MNTGKIIADARDAKAWSQTDLADASGVSRVMIGKYERGEAVPSLDAAKKIADALEVSLDYLVGEGVNNKFDKKTLKLQEIELIEEPKKTVLFDLIDTYIRDAKVRKAQQYKSATRKGLRLCLFSAKYYFTSLILFKALINIF